MLQVTNNKRYDLEERTLTFSKKIINFIASVPKTLVNIAICRQLIKSGTSIGANYIEANESLSKKGIKRNYLLVETHSTREKSSN